MKQPNKIMLFASCICLYVFTALPASAQFSAGIGAGANLATQSTQQYYHVFLARPYIGVFGQYQLNSPLSLQLGLNYSGEGVNLKDQSTDDTYHSRLGYLNIPLFLRYNFSFGGYVEVGPQVGFLLSAKENANGDASVDTKQYYKSTDFGAGLGLGYQFDGGFGINLRYIRGLSAINNIPADNGDDVKNRVLSIGISYTFLSNSSHGKK
jgi:hypothetical protein